jgi:AraC-like DNA-binding protein
MKTFNEVNYPSKSTVSRKERGLPTFEQIVELMSDPDSVEDLAEASGVSSKELRTAIQAVHDLELQIQKLEMNMLATRDQFVALPKDDAKRDPLRQELVQLNKDKTELQKKLQRAEIELQRALSREEIDDVEIDLL